jgi:hypothetical protein
MTKVESGKNESLLVLLEDQSPEVAFVHGSVVVQVLSCRARNDGDASLTKPYRAVDLFLRGLQIVADIVATGTASPPHSARNLRPSTTAAVCIKLRSCMGTCRNPNAGPSPRRRAARFTRKTRNRE